MENVRKEQKEQLLHSLDEKPKPKKKNSSLVVGLVYVLLLAAGVGTGYLLSTGNSASSSDVSQSTAEGTESTQQQGSTNDSCPTGALETGGLEGEGTHKLVRPGGASQTAYLMSSVLDLDEYVGKTVRVCGETMQAKKAGWLMDVEQVEVQ